MNPLDLIFFKGDDIVGKFVSIGENIAVGNSEFTHVGIVVTRELLDMPELIPGVSYLLESTVSYDSSSVNILTGEVTYGVQIRKLTDVISSYRKCSGCRIAWARLMNNPFFEHRDIIIQNFKKVFDKYRNSLYDFNVLDLIAAAIPCCRKRRDFFEKVIVDGSEIFHNLGIFQNTHQWVFCSELVAIIYKSLGIFDKGIDPRDVIPMDLLGFDKDGLPRVVDTPVYLS